MKKIKLKDKEFGVSIPSEDIQKVIVNLAKKINTDFKDAEIPLFISILNGSFMFTADLLKHIDFNCEITFLKLSSYQGTSSTGNVKELIGINENIKGRKIIVLEDIVDTGITLEQIVNELEKYNPEEIRVSTLLFKPAAYQKNINIDYVGMEIPNDFIIGYGLDYDGLGRNLADIYTLIQK
ncbi:MAG: hypoxanthine phosphoribosyltransferase [Bacteroidetes bacterium GWC2_33_15]|nr:MAG: hypoxanthine phosphoribosyltransferase [Bacteroidetes bacterium GWA2_33_15]OFX51368.1 MAG: hypoxanthine phosphoribosyltransferase [Bacteroidetes bacterium GWC2_33_15]OFX63152.1 MAG: hypoxanthine phosphoribosyltransferase [Bacteroidetes bacterium GWB2_32_14]OFX70744.1 MAG: hypoxanthine phosphoribosyltransferase [Bacteroidetes bacterium GWD2_33_33]HAN18457.1 hypoxanthine phosphoribosyltransferase [Bacteroidales bacterium]